MAAGDPLKRPSPVVMVVAWIAFIGAIWWGPTHGGSAGRAWPDTVFISVVLPLFWYFYPRWRR
jgi:hypothetical protein